MPPFPFLWKGKSEENNHFNTSPPNAVPYSNVRKVLSILTSHLKFEYLQKNSQILCFHHYAFKRWSSWLCSAHWFVLLTNPPLLHNNAEEQRPVWWQHMCTQRHTGILGWKSRALKMFIWYDPNLHMYSTAVVFVILGVYYFRVPILISRVVVWFLQTNALVVYG